MKTELYYRRFVSPDDGRNGFTIVELLAVIAIISILVVMIAGSLDLIRKKAGAATCLGNLRQIAAASALYASDNDGYIAPIMIDQRNEQNGIVSSRWWIELAPYLPYKPVSNINSPNLQNEPKPVGGERVYVCPSNSRTISRGGAYVNYLGIINASGNTYIPFLKETRRKLVSFRAPLSSLPYLIDGYASDFYGTIHPHAVDLMLPLEEIRGDINASDPSAGVFKPIHGNSINILYLDGHAAPSVMKEFKAATFDYSKP